MKLLFPIFLILLCFACDNFDGETASNYPYQFHVNKKGDTPQVGDLVIFHERVLLNKEEIFSTEKKSPKKIILPKAEILTKPLPPNYEVLFKMSAGDSVTVFQNLSNLKNLPKGYTLEDELQYIIKLIEIQPADALLLDKKKSKTASNYSFRFLNKRGNVAAQVGDRVRYREYRYIRDSLVFGSPMEKPMQSILPPREEISFPPPGNYESLLLGGIGDSLHLLQPLSDLKKLPKGFKKNDTINYRIQILEILTPGEYVISQKIKNANQAAEKAAVQARRTEVEKMTLSNLEKFKNGELEDDLQYTHSQLKYIIHKQGNGKKPFPMEKVKVHFAGFLMDGTPFDDSFTSGKPLTFPLGMGRVIKGWEEGIAKLNRGGKATFFVPYQLAYGRRGKPPKIPWRADLVFYVELLDEEK